MPIRKPVSESVKMDQLPVELYQCIFEHLEITELFDLRLVSKKLNYAVSEFRAKELVFDSSYKYRYNWSFSRKPINSLNVLPSTKQFVLRSGLFSTKGLRFLKICLSINKCRGVKLSHINTFVHLTHLEIDAGTSNPDDRLLNLANLKVLSFSITMHQEAPDLVLDLPKLTALNLDCSLHGLTFEHPKTVKQLKVHEYEPKLSNFRNVERLECFYLSGEHNPPRRERENPKLNLLLNFPQLNELLVETDYQNKLREVIEEKVRLEKHEIKIYYRSLECLSYQDLRQFRDKNFYLTHYTLDQHFKYYQRLADDLDFVDEMDYSLLASRFESIPVDFFDKYTNINRLYLHNRTNQALFLSFVGRCTNLGLLSICNSKFSQSFYDQLPDVSNLFELYVEERSNPANLDVSFVCRMKSLRIFKTNFELARKEIKKLCGPQAGHLEEFGMAANRNLIVQIEPTTEARFCLKNESGLKLFNKEIDLSTLIAWMEYLKKDMKTTRSAFKKMRKV